MYGMKRNTHHFCTLMKKILGSNYSMVLVVYDQEKIILGSNYSMVLVVGVWSGKNQTAPGTLRHVFFCNIMFVLPKLPLYLKKADRFLNQKSSLWHADSHSSLFHSKPVIKNSQHTACRHSSSTQPVPYNQTCVEEPKCNQLVHSRQALVCHPGAERTSPSIHLGVQGIDSTT